MTNRVWLWRRLVGTNGKHSILRQRFCCYGPSGCCVTSTLHKSGVVLPSGATQAYCINVRINEGVHLRHHEVRLLRDQRVLLVDELDPLLDHVGRAAAAWKWKKKPQRLVMNNCCLGTKRGRQDHMEILYIVLWNKTDVLRVTQRTMWVRFLEAIPC